MSTIQRPGIYPKWSINSKSFYRDQAKWRDRQRPDVAEKLEYYVVHGRYPPSELSSHLRNDWPGWMSYLGGDLGGLGRVYLSELESASVLDRRPFDVALAVRAFAAIYTAEMTMLLLHAPPPRRTYRLISYSAVATTALGVIIGCDEEAFRLARLQVLAHRRGFCSAGEEEPIFLFMLRLLADYLKEPPLELPRAVLEEPIFLALFDLWRSPDPAALVDICLAACDEHTQRTRPGGTGVDFEFSNGKWHCFPIEILLLFKLRELLGLANPLIDHPIMSTPVGRLPEQRTRFTDIAAGPDDLVFRVRQRMMQDGYDEEAIYRRCLAGNIEGPANAPGTAFNCLTSPLW